MDRLSQFLAANEGQAELSLGQGEAQRHYDVRLSPLQDPHGQPIGRLIVLRDITQQKRMEEERELLLQQLQSTLAEIRKLTGLLPICADCKRIRDDQGCRPSRRMLGTILTPSSVTESVRIACKNSILTCFRMKSPRSDSPSNYHFLQSHSC